jgi:hypothetical protein
MNQKHVGWISLEIPMGLKIKKKKKESVGKESCAFYSAQAFWKKKRIKKAALIWLTELKKTLLYPLFVFFNSIKLRLNV